MSQTHPRPADRYSPLYFLASLGAGGLAVTFFMYLMFWVPHPGQPVPVFEDIARAFTSGALPLQAAIAIAVTGIALLGLTNLRLLIWNLAAYRRFAASPAYGALISSNADSQRMALPLALAMSINACFVMGMVFVPGLWSVVEYLFPAAIVAFGLVGLLALKISGQFLTRIFTQAGSFKMEQNGSFAQLLPGFAFAMISVGFAAPAAMSTIPTTVGIALIGSTFFGVAALLWTLVALTLGVLAMLQHGVAREAAPTLLVVIPLLTVLGIMGMRQDHGMHATFAAHSDPIHMLMFLSRILAAQLLFGLIGLAVLRAQGYSKAFLTGTPSPGAYALVCPGVALSVMLHFWLNKGLVAVGLIEKFSASFWIITAIAIAFQLAMIALVLFLNRQHFRLAAPGAVPAE